MLLHSEEDYPAYSRDELLNQLAPLWKKYTLYTLYSNATVDEKVNELKGKNAR
ncbi:hypothetical protein [Spirosoma pulveris]